jgi:hypothetical protein
MDQETLRRRIAKHTALACMSGVLVALALWAVVFVVLTAHPNKILEDVLLAAANAVTAGVNVVFVRRNLRCRNALRKELQRVSIAELEQEKERWERDHG